jgi:mRNA interferase MazF
MKRGGLVTVSVPGDNGKPRPAVVIQSDHLTEAGLRSTIVCLVASHIEDAPAFRLDLEPSEGSGLAERSQIMIDKLLTLPIAKIGTRIGRLDDEVLVRLNRTLAFVVGLAD